ncbi:MAG: electron transport complex subunit RsxC, partial [Phycisphaerales bacterium]|nr:electron transport complex subunit RsxC [Phycisphaerales bacterium]
HPHENKEQTEHFPIARMAFGKVFTLPLSQHLGAPSKPIVQVGQTVFRGQLLAKAGGYVSANLHSPVDGKVIAIGPCRHPRGDLATCIELEADPFSTQSINASPQVDPMKMSTDDFVTSIQDSGLVGLGGAAFPTHVKYKLPEGKTCEHLAINGCECEPYLTCDHRTMIERPEAVIRGITIAAKVLGAKKTSIGIEKNKPDAIAAMQDATNNLEDIEIYPLKVKYPQGAEKMLIKAIYGIEVPAGKLPLDVGVVVNNVATMTQFADWFDEGLPLIERVVTVAGTAIARPANLIIPVGTSVREVLEFCGLDMNTQQVIMGGPMMGMPLSSLDVPVLKGTSGLLAFTEAPKGHQDTLACISCGQCLEACGYFLNPARLAKLAQARRWDELDDFYVNDCMECGACSWVCPSSIPIVQLIRTGKVALRELKATQEA